MARTSIRNEVRKDVTDLAQDASNTMSSIEMERRIQELHSQVTALTDNLKKIGANKLDDYKMSMQKLAADAVLASRNALGTAKDEALSLEEGLERRVREKPLQALAIAAGLGFLAAILSRRG